MSMGITFSYHITKVKLNVSWMFIDQGTFIRKNIVCQSVCHSVTIQPKSNSMSGGCFLIKGHLLERIRYVNEYKIQLSYN